MDCHDEKDDVQSNPSSNSKAFAVFQDSTQDFRNPETSLPGLGDLDLSNAHTDHGTELNSRAEPVTQLDTIMQSDSKSISLRNRTPLANNSLKINLTPRSNSQQSIQKSIFAERSPGQKFRMHDSDDELPRKSSKIRAFDSPSGKRQSISPTSISEIKIDPTAELTISGSPRRASKFLEGSMNDRTSKCPPPEIIGPDAVAVGDDLMDVDAKPSEELYADFTGETLPTPRPSGMYTFNSPAKTWNPLKAISKFFSWPSSISSPSKQPAPSLNSEAITQQVEAHIQGLEDRILSRLAALRAGELQDQSGTHRRSTLDLLGSTIEKEIDISHLHTPAGLSSTQPVQNSFSFSTPNILLQSSEAEHITQSLSNQHEHPPVLTKVPHDRFATFQRLSTKASMAFRNSISPTKPKTIQPSDELTRVQQQEVLGEQSSPELPNVGSPQDDVAESVIHQSRAPSSLDLKELPELPGLKNKASQHLKKMASKMNLRNRKPKREDALLVNSLEYRVMKKKNKDEILKDYLTLRKEKAELEKRLANGPVVGQSRTSTEDAVQPSSSPERQIQTEMEFSTATPLLLAATTPDFTLKIQGADPSALDDEKSSPAKRKIAKVSTSLPLASSPLELIHEDKYESNDEQNAILDQAKARTDPTDGVANNETVSTMQKQLQKTNSESSPMRSGPVRHHSKVPKPSREAKGRISNKKDQLWTGWDEDVF